MDGTDSNVCNPSQPSLNYSDFNTGCNIIDGQCMTACEFGSGSGGCSSIIEDQCGNVCVTSSSANGGTGNVYLNGVCFPGSFGGGGTPCCVGGSNNYVCADNANDICTYALNNACTRADCGSASISANQSVSMSSDSGGEVYLDNSGDVMLSTCNGACLCLTECGNVTLASGNEGAIDIIASDGTCACGSVYITDNGGDSLCLNGSSGALLQGSGGGGICANYSGSVLAWASGCGSVTLQAGGNNAIVLDSGGNVCLLPSCGECIVTSNIDMGCCGCYGCTGTLEPGCIGNLFVVNGLIVGWC